MLIVTFDIVDQAFVQRPGVELTFPVVDDRVAETEHFALHIRNAGGDPGRFGRLQGFFGRIGQESVNGILQLQSGSVRIAEDSMGDIGVVLDHGLRGFAVHGLLGSRCRFALGGGGLRGSGLFGRSFVFAATSE